MYNDQYVTGTIQIYMHKTVDSNIVNNKYIHQYIKFRYTFIFWKHSSAIFSMVLARTHTHTNWKVTIYVLISDYSWLFHLLSPCLHLNSKASEIWTTLIPAQGVPARHKVLHWTSAPWTRLRYPWCTSLLWCRTQCHPSQSTIWVER